MRYLYAVVVSFLVIFLLCGCADRDRVLRPGVVQFRDLYSVLSEPRIYGDVKGAQDKLITLSLNELRLVDCCRTLSDFFGVSIAYDAGLDSAKLSFELKSSSLSESLSAIARRVGKRVAKIGSVWFIGELAPEDRAVLVRRATRMDKEEMDKFLSLFLSEFGRAFALAEGTCVIADRVDVLTKIAEALDGIESTASPCWVVQVILISLSESDKLELGLTLDQTAKLSWNVGQNSPEITGVFSALLTSVADSSTSRIMAQPLILVRDGSRGEIKNGQTTPVAKKTVSQYGVVETTGYDFIDTGLLLSVAIRDNAQYRARAQVKIEISRIAGYVDNAVPIVAKQSADSDVDIQSGGVYLLASLAESEASTGWSGKIVPSVYSRAARAGEIQVWARVYKIGSAVTPTGRYVASGATVADVK